MPEVAFDKILNEAIIDASRELLERERYSNSLFIIYLIIQIIRIYGENAEPLPWSSRTKVVKYKYVDNEASKDCLVNYVKRNVTNIYIY